MRITVIGGAAIGLVYDSTHATTDIDLVPVASAEFWSAVARVGRGAVRAIPVSPVAIFAAPYAYEDRLVRLELAGLLKLVVEVPEAHDLALMKVARGEGHDLAAVEDMHRLRPLDLEVLIRRYWETLTQVTGSLRDFRLSFLVLVERLYGLARAGEVEARLDRTRPPPIASEPASLGFDPAPRAPSSPQLMPIHWPSERVVVTGGAGFLGSFVVEELRRRGATEVFVPRSQDYDLVDMEAVKRALPRRPRPPSSSTWRRGSAASAPTATTRASSSTTTS